MNINEIKQLYVENGFSWTSHLEEFMRLYAGKTFEYRHHIGNLSMKTWFFDPLEARLGHTDERYRLIAAHLGEEVAPTGQCADGNYDLFLTLSGDLIGSADYLLLSWSTQESPNWQDSITRLLRGETPQRLGVVDTPDD